jgi:hypothetical protein
MYSQLPMDIIKYKIFEYLTFDHIVESEYFHNLHITNNTLKKIPNMD